MWIISQCKIVLTKLWEEGRKSEWMEGKFTSAKLWKPEKTIFKKVVLYSGTFRTVHVFRKSFFFSFYSPRNKKPKTDRLKYPYLFWMVVLNLEKQALLGKSFGWQWSSLWEKGRWVRPGLLPADGGVGPPHCVIPSCPESGSFLFPLWPFTSYISWCKVNRKWVLFKKYIISLE